MNRIVILIMVMVPLLWVADGSSANLMVHPEVDCVYDDDLNLSWIRNANLAGNPIDWPEALEWVNNLYSAGFDGWRLPSIEELTHINKVEGVSGVDPGPFRNLKADDYWSSTEYAPGSRYAWSFTFGWKFPHWGYKGYKHFVWPVHQGRCS
jgi:hypothetical protein